MSHASGTGTGRGLETGQGLSGVDTSAGDDRTIRPGATGPGPSEGARSDRCFETREALSVATVAIEERELLKSLRWWDGFVVALANPGFLIGSLGFSIGSLGGWGAMLLWTISMLMGVAKNWIY